ncbi:MAG: hypothetical protein FWE78_04860, partial [Methanimicrococcus sp.]|nr:hypothetical protein [Methanimicrococcus sp.]
YYVEKEINGSWYLIPPVSGDGFAWHAIAYTLNKNSTAEQELYWERTYGNLDAGNYRINKEILYIRAPGDFDKFNVYAEFVID